MTVFGIDITIVITIASTLTAVGVIWTFWNKLSKFLSRHIGRLAVKELDAKDFDDTPYLGAVIRRQDILEGEMKKGFLSLENSVAKLYEMEKEDRIERYGDSMRNETLPIVRRFTSGTRCLELDPENRDNKTFFKTVVEPEYQKYLKESRVSKG